MANKTTKTRWQRFEAWFNRNVAWFFTNGRKLAKPVPVTSENLRELGFELKYGVNGRPKGEPVWLYLKPLASKAIITLDRFEEEDGTMTNTFEIVCGEVHIVCKVTNMGQIVPFVLAFAEMKPEEVKDTCLLAVAKIKEEHGLTEARCSNTGVK